MELTVNIFLIALTSIISFVCFSNESLKQQLLFYPYQIHTQGKGYYRFITHGFVHADMIHLLFNMITLYYFGDNVERYLNKHYGSPVGSSLYLLFYVAGLIIASIPSYFRYRNNQYYRSLGASGAVSAILFASILISPLSQICLYRLKCIRAYIFGPLYLVYSVYEAKRAKDNIGHDAHFTGAIFGLIFIVALVPETLSNFIQTIIDTF